MDKMKFLQEEARRREGEIFHYQLNIDNYERAVKKIDAMPDWEKDIIPDFRDGLEKLLESEYREQKKSKIMLEVIQDQLEEMKCNTPK